MDWMIVASVQFSSWKPGVLVFMWMFCAPWNPPKHCVRHALGCSWTIFEVEVVLMLWQKAKLHRISSTNQQPGGEQSFSAAGCPILSYNSFFVPSLPQSTEKDVVRRINIWFEALKTYPEHVQSLNPSRESSSLYLNTLWVQKMPILCFGNKYLISTPLGQMSLLICPTLRVSGEMAAGRYTSQLAEVAHQYFSAFAYSENIKAPEGKYIPFIPLHPNNRCEDIKCLSICFWNSR